MRENIFENVDMFQYTFARDSIQEAFDSIAKEYSLDIMLSMFEDVKGYIESEYETDLSNYEILETPRKTVKVKGKITKAYRTSETIEKLLED